MSNNGFPIEGSKQKPANAGSKRKQRVNVNFIAEGIELDCGAEVRGLAFKSGEFDKLGGGFLNPMPVNSYICIGRRRCATLVAPTTPPFLPFEVPLIVRG